MNIPIPKNFSFPGDKKDGDEIEVLARLKIDGDQFEVLAIDGNELAEAPEPDDEEEVDKISLEEYNGMNPSGRFMRFMEGKSTPTE